MKELTVYFSFFKNSLLYLIVCSVIGLIGGYLVFQQQEIVYRVEAVYELQNQQLSGEEKLLIAEEVVGLIREAAVVENIGITDVEDLYISRIGPFAVKIISASNTPQRAGENLNSAVSLISERGNFVLSGSELYMRDNPSFILFLFGGLGTGLALGIFAGLVKTYLKNF